MGSEVKNVGSIGVGWFCVVKGEGRRGVDVGGWVVCAGCRC
jgi:hypothetical protein